MTTEPLNLQHLADRLISELAATNPDAAKTFLASLLEGQGVAAREIMIDVADLHAREAMSREDIDSKAFHIVRVQTMAIKTFIHGLQIHATRWQRGEHPLQQAVEARGEEESFGSVD